MNAVDLLESHPERADEIRALRAEHAALTERFNACVRAGDERDAARLAREQAAISVKLIDIGNGAA